MSIEKEISTLSSMFLSGVFKKHIYTIRYPKFRNLEPNTKITFDFPVTFFVGKNGGGKSSTLQSLYGAPKNYSLGDYWFTTDLDPIKEIKDNRNCFIYEYKINNELFEVLKQRSTREGRLDYWEPSRPLMVYQMRKKRVSPVIRNVAYIDFRSELSAYDKFMHFESFSPGKKFKSKQDYLRFYSRKLKNALDDNIVINSHNREKNRRKTVLKGVPLDIINNILGKKYSEIEVIEHCFFKNWGASIRLKSPELNISEAYAGSGETAIVMLVHKIYNAKKDSLILLDEPETSLHSGAQKRLLLFLLEQCKLKSLQIVISTHSPFLLDGMPANSIKVFSSNNIAQFHVENQREAREALVELEISKSSDKVQVILEDNLSCTILDKVLEKMGAHIKESFLLSYLPGGADAIKQRMAYILGVSTLPYIVFDGDQKLLENHIDLASLPVNQSDTYHKLSQLLKQQTRCDINFFVDGGNANNEIQKVQYIKDYFDYYKTKVLYLPRKIPEDIIWCDNLATKRLELYGASDIPLLLNTFKTGTSKEWFVKLCKHLYQDLKHLDALHVEFTINWLHKKDESFFFICDLLNKMRKTQ